MSKCHLFFNTPTADLSLSTLSCDSNLAGRAFGPHMGLANNFYKYFDIVEIDNLDHLSQALKLRYQVYAIERQIPGFEADRYPDKKESDEYDQRSAHALLIHKQSKDVAGTVRLVCADKSCPGNPLPVENHLVPEHGFCIHKNLRHEVAEISRLMLSARFRSRQGEREWIDGLSDSLINTVSDSHNRRFSPHPVLGLIRACVVMSWKNGIRFLCASMESRLCRRMRVFGIHWSQVTPEIEFHGKVNVYFNSIPELLQRCYKENIEVWRFLTDDGDVWPLNQEYTPIIKS